MIQILSPEFKAAAITTCVRYLPGDATDGTLLGHEIAIANYSNILYLP